ncbi:MAG: primosomal protein N' [Bacteroidales bacterium]|jgi:primosomal protein N' (replication factor Y)|nr:primosomal protein N' [Bacteroidales bacterium]
MSDSPLFADVILPLPLKQLFTYSIPASYTQKAKTGKRVIVQFGKRKIYAAIIYRIHHQKPTHYETKDILSLLDDDPIVNESQLSLWQWIADYYMCSLGEVFKAALPSGLKLESETKVIYNAENTDIKKFSSTESLVLDFLEKTNIAKVNDIAQALNKKEALPVIKSLLDKKAVILEEKLKESYKPRTETYLDLHPSIKNEKELNKTFDSLKNAPKQLEVLMTFIQLSGKFFKKEPAEVSRLTLLKKSGASHPVIKSLIQKNILTEYTQTISRLDRSAGKARKAKQLSIAQNQAYESIQEQFKEKQVVLLHGVTSSGKTEIYIQLMQEQIKKGKQVLYLLPEIALTAQIINRLKSVFGNRVGIYHSRFNDGERVEVYQNVLQSGSDSRYDIILGVRSSLFLPFSNLGLIIVDEEHENTYKQYDPAPRYNARDSAMVLARIHQARVLLGTATPSIESYFNAKTGKYGLSELNSRFQEIKMPQIILSDTLKARKKKQMKSHFSPALLDHIRESLQNKEQVILFQNRRGFAPFLECDTCGWIPYCKHCDVSMTYHKQHNELVCHYCGHTIKNPKVCKACGNTSLTNRGFGTEKVEDEISIFFPEARVKRMDLDSTRSKFAYEKIIGGFEQGEIDILIGTQMVSKGLDFDNVGLVGILNADNMLNYPDFRAFERSYQLMAQVSGRAGRKNKQGKVIIQTSHPEHQILQFVLDNNYQEMYKTQLYERKNFNYPPYCRLISVSIKHKRQEVVHRSALQLANNLKKIFGKRVLGPESPVIARIQNLYIQKILLKIERQRSFQRARSLLDEQLTRLITMENFKTIQVSIDVDPV